jgi:hypothetical protein
MRSVVLKQFVVTVSLSICSLWSFGGTALDEKLPNSAAVVERMVRRADEAGRAHDAGKYSYEKHTHSEELDAAGKITKSTDKLYEVVPINGIPFARLVKIQNRDLTGQELEQQKRKEEEFRLRVKAAHGRGKVTTDEDWLTASLIERYVFRVERRECVENRSTLVVSFHPKPEHQVEKNIEDKVLNRLAGLLWVDEQEAELVRAEVSLTEDLWLGWLGMVGSLKRCDIKIQRQRLVDGGWVNKQQSFELDGRKVFTPMHFRSVEEFYNFRRP